MQTSTLTMKEHDVRAASQREYKALHAFSERFQAETHAPPESLEQAITRFQQLPADLDCTTFALWEGEMIVAEGGCIRRGTADTQRPGQLSIWVLPEYRRRGLGRRLLAAAAEVAARKQWRLLTALTASPAGERFMEHIGAVRGMAGHTNQLVLAEVDRALLRCWIERGERLAGEFELGLWDGPYPEAQIEAIARLWDVMNSAPRNDFDLQEFRVRPEQLREAERALFGQGTQRWTFYVRERSTGQLAGFSEVSWDPNQREIIQQGNTGVLPRYRKRGLGRWLKAAMLEKILRERPDVPFVHTATADANAPMLKINTELGFRPFQTTQWWRVELDAIEAYLRR